MTIRALAGLLMLNAFFLVAGAALLFALRAWRTWIDLVRLAGVAYLVGVTAFVVILSLELVLGVPFRPSTIVGTGLVLVLGGATAARRRGQSWPEMRPREWRPPTPTVVGALVLAAISVYFLALFRSARLAPVFEWDAWQVWTQRAKELVYFDGLGPDTLYGGYDSYPPGVSILQAAAFEAMGSVDVVTLHVQWWFLAVGAVAALAGLLAPLVRPAVLLPFLLLLVLMPGFVERATSDVMADLPLGYLVAVAALLVVLWLEERQSWQLLAASVLLAGAQLTKREGLLLAACVVGAALVATWSERRSTWRPLVLAGVGAAVLALPWRIWFTLQGMPGDGPESGYLGSLTLLGRVWPALDLTVETLVAYDLWLVVPALAIVAAFLALVAGTTRTPVFATAFLVLSVLAMSWAIWSNTSFTFGRDIQASPVTRLTGTSALVLGAIAPLLLSQALASGAWPRRDPSRRRESRRLRSTLATAVVAGALLAYTGSMLVGVSSFRLPGGPPTFPSASDCVPESDGGRVRVVLGYADSYPEALSLRTATVELGLPPPEVRRDGCGRVRVTLADVSTVAEGRRLASRAHALGLAPRLEREGDG